MLNRIVSKLSDLSVLRSATANKYDESPICQRLNTFQVHQGTVDGASEAILDRSGYIASLIQQSELTVEINNPDLKSWRKDSSVKGEFNRKRQHRNAEITLARSLKLKEVEGDEIDKIFLAGMLGKESKSVLSDYSASSITSYAKALSLLLESEYRNLQDQLPSAWRELRSKIRENSHDRKKLLSALETFVPNDFISTLFGGDPFETNEDLRQPIKRTNWGFIPSNLNSVISQLSYLQGMGDMENKTFADLGCGKGNVALLAALCLSKKVIGVDYSESLINFAKEYSKYAEIPGSEWKKEDVLETDLSQIDCFYSYSPFRSQNMISQFSTRLCKEAAKRPIVIAASYPDLICALEESSAVTKLKNANYYWSIFKSIGT